MTSLTSKYTIDFLKEEDDLFSSDAAAAAAAAPIPLVRLRTFDGAALQQCLATLSKHTADNSQQLVSLHAKHSEMQNRSSEQIDDLSTLRFDQKANRDSLYRVSEDVKQLRASTLPAVSFQQFISGPFSEATMKLGTHSTRLVSLEHACHPATLLETISRVISLEVTPLLGQEKAEREGERVALEKRFAARAAEQDARIAALEARLAALTAAAGPQQLEIVHKKLDALDKKSELARLDVRSALHSEMLEARCAVKSVELQVVDAASGLRDVQLKQRELRGLIDDVRRQLIVMEFDFGKGGAQQQQQFSQHGSIFNNSSFLHRSGSPDLGAPREQRTSTSADAPSSVGAFAALVREEQRREERSTLKRREDAQSLRDAIVAAIIDETVAEIVRSLTEPELAAAVLQAAVVARNQQESGRASDNNNSKNNSSSGLHNNPLSEHGQSGKVSGSTIFGSSVEPVWFSGALASVSSGSRKGHQQQQQQLGSNGDDAIDDQLEQQQQQQQQQHQQQQQQEEEEGVENHRDVDDGISGTPTSTATTTANSRSLSAAEISLARLRSRNPTATTAAAVAAAAGSGRAGGGGIRSNNFSRRPMSTESAAASPSSLADLLFRFNEDRFHEVRERSLSPHRGQNE